MRAPVTHRRVRRRRSIDLPLALGCPRLPTPCRFTLSNVQLGDVPTTLDPRFRGDDGLSVVASRARLPSTGTDAVVREEALCARGHRRRRPARRAFKLSLLRGK